MSGVTNALVCAILSGIVNIKDTMMLMGKSSSCSGANRFPLSLSGWTITICPMPYNWTKCVEWVFKWNIPFLPSFYVRYTKIIYFKACYYVILFVIVAVNVVILFIYYCYYYNISVLYFQLSHWSLLSCSQQWANQMWERNLPGWDNSGCV